MRLKDKAGPRLKWEVCKRDGSLDLNRLYQSIRTRLMFVGKYVKVEYRVHYFFGVRESTDS